MSAHDVMNTYVTQVGLAHGVTATDCLTSNSGAQGRGYVTCKRTFFFY